MIQFSSSFRVERVQDVFSMFTKQQVFNVKLEAILDLLAKEKEDHFQSNSIAKYFKRAGAPRTKVD